MTLAVKFDIRLLQRLESLQFYLNVFRFILDYDTIFIIKHWFDKLFGKTVQFVGRN